MAIRSNKAVMAGLDLLQGRAVRGIGAPYRQRVIEPLTKVIRQAESYDDLRSALAEQRQPGSEATRQRGNEAARQRGEEAGPAIMAAMDEGIVAEALASTGVQAGLIARVAARPRGMRNAEL